MRPKAGQAALQWVSPCRDAPATSSTHLQASHHHWGDVMMMAAHRPGQLWRDGIWGVAENVLRQLNHATRGFIVTLSLGRALRAGAARPAAPTFCPGAEPRAALPFLRESRARHARDFTGQHWEPEAPKQSRSLCSDLPSASVGLAEAGAHRGSSAQRTCERAGAGAKEGFTQH